VLFHSESAFHFFALERIAFFEGVRPFVEPASFGFFAERRLRGTTRFCFLAVFFVFVLFDFFAVPFFAGFAARFTAFGDCLTGFDDWDCRLSSESPPRVF